MARSINTIREASPTCWRPSNAKRKTPVGQYQISRVAHLAFCAESVVDVTSDYTNDPICSRGKTSQNERTNRAECAIGGATERVVDAASLSRVAGRPEARA